MSVITANPQRSAVEGPLGAWPLGVFEAFRNWIAYRRTIRALAALSDRELADIGIHRGEIRAVARNAR